MSKKFIFIVCFMVLIGCTPTAEEVDLVARQLHPTETLTPTSIPSPHPTHSPPPQATPTATPNMILTEVSMTVTEAAKENCQTDTVLLPRSQPTTRRNYVFVGNTDDERGCLIWYYADDDATQFVVEVSTSVSTLTSTGEYETVEEMLFSAETPPDISQITLSEEILFGCPSNYMFFVYAIVDGERVSVDGSAVTVC